MLQLILSPPPFDAVVVGSGATGGWAAKRLTKVGLRVALLEAGKKTTAIDFTEYNSVQDGTFSHPSPQIRSERPIQSICYACREPKHHWFVNDFENPYHQIKPYRWIRMRVLGGRLLGWEGHSYRMSNLDFKAASHDGYGDDWPISYEDLIPYYEEVERYLGITGKPENIPHLPDSIFLSTESDNLTASVIRDTIARKFGRVVTPARLAVMTRSYDCKQTCYYCGPSEDGHYVASHFSSPWNALADAAKTGRLTLITEAIASHILMKDGKAVGVAYIDRDTRASREVRAKLVILCASTLESTRLLLNSNICNSSGVLGRYLMDHIWGGGATGVVERGTNDLCVDSRQRHRVYVPRFRNVQKKLTDGFIRGYGLQGKSILDFGSDNPEKEEHHAAREAHWKVQLMSFGECLARKENFVEIDRDRLDAWGIPTLKIRAGWSQNELDIWYDAAIQAAEMLEAAGLRDLTLAERPSVPGGCIHEMGTARMGNSPTNSVVTAYCQAHDVPNVFVTDGACWVSSGCQNPTLTMMAITVRACDYITREYSKLVY